ncbi:MAG: UDP-N-acetylmuramate dehydrogenase [Deltaproteobacteria bacterium]|nr:MAG: UDP-N-acetylmuramate dehydrogenase [Deltaproteobacteria bacterium]
MTAAAEIYCARVLPGGIDERSEAAEGGDPDSSAGGIDERSEAAEGGDPDSSAGGAGGSAPRGIDERSEAAEGGDPDSSAGGAGGSAPRGIDERSEAAEGGDPDSSAGGAGGSAPRGIDVELIGDEDLGDGEVSAAAVANPGSRLDDDARRALRELLGDGVRFDEPLRRHTTLKIGGPADAFCEPASVAEVSALARWCAAAGVPITVIGGGSNLIVRDGGVRGAVLGTGRLRGLALTPPATIRVEAGVSTGKVLSLAMKNDLGGVEFLGGVPGSVGGGMIMNAGTYLGEFKDVTRWVETVRLADGEVIRRDSAACGFRYRASDLPPGEVVVGAELVLRPRPRADIQAEVSALRKRRAEREPKKVASNGSTFKNPPGDFAGRLIEVAGCKGWREGDAVCSPVHANWLVNTGRASAAELLQLIERVRAHVLQIHGIALELEVKIIGED